MFRTRSWFWTTASYFSKQMPGLKSEQFGEGHRRSVWYSLSPSSSIPRKQIHSVRESGQQLEFFFDFYFRRICLQYDWVASCQFSSRMSVCLSKFKNVIGNAAICILAFCDECTFATVICSFAFAIYDWRVETDQQRPTLAWVGMLCLRHVQISTKKYIHTSAPHRLSTNAR
jgi:hypothetical protein